MNLASATDLQRWADVRESQGTLPQLVRRLISATANGLVELSMRAGEGVALSGWDGVVGASEPDAHVPGGRSVWEMGVGRDPSAKANQDYRKRTDDPAGSNPAESVFVFVTPRRWPAKDDWVRDKAAEGVWNAVVVYDADDLETWLERAPYVHAWISALLGKDPYEVESLETWWETWAGATNPPLQPELLISGRDAEVERIREMLTSTPTSLTVSGDSQEAVTAFIAAALQASSGMASSELERSLIVRTPSAWRRVAVTDAPAILVPLFDNPEVPIAVRRGHSVILPLGREVEADSGIRLPRLRRGGIQDALSAMGIPNARVMALATVGRRSLLSLRRALAVHRELQRPVWAEPDNARTVLPAVLAGRWSEHRGGDRAALSRLAGRPYEELSAELTRWANATDPPLRRVGDIWLISAKDDAWTLLARYATDDDLERFTAVVQDVIGGEDPTVGLTRVQRRIAPLLDQRREHSEHLIEGLANTLALMSATSDHVDLPGGRRAHQLATMIVRSLLEAANEDLSGHRWIAIANSLPLLAEAAPETFLASVEAGLAGEDPVLMKLFQDGEGFDSFFGNSAHPSLLWALEGLAWSTDYLGQAAVLLARLSRLDPGGRLSNRPAVSLRDVLLMWRPGTSATVDQRLEVVDLIRRQEPDVAWSLMLQLLPSGHESATATHSPTWRDWKPEEEQRVTYGELGGAVRELARRALEDVGARGDRWAELLGRFADFPNGIREDVVSRLADPALEFDDADKANVAAELHRLIEKHREYADADWAMSPEDVDRLEEVLPRLEPADPLLRSAWLFQPGASRHRRRRDPEARDLYEAQRDAMAECLATMGVEDILEWAETFDTNGYSQRAIGWALAAAGVPETEAEDVLLNVLVADSLEQRIVAAAFVSKTAQARGTNLLHWAEELIRTTGEAWEADHKAAFLAVLPATEDVWSLVESLGAKVEREYWQRKGVYDLPSNPPLSDQAARKLLEYDQPYQAVMLLDPQAEGVYQTPLDLLAEALERALETEPPDPLDNMFSYQVDRQLSRLEEAGFDERRLARIEWGYLPLFRYEKRSMRVLHRTLADQPGFFVQVVEVLYRAEGEEPRDLSPEEATRVATARDLLDSWRLVPGMTDDGSIDTAALNEWVDAARAHLAESGRLEMGDHRIGQMLRYGPAPSEGQWPAPEICELIDRIGSDHLESGFRMEVLNSRGVTSRALTAGGQQERALAERYRGFAEGIRLSSPRTAALLRSLAEWYEVEADRHDADAELTEDLWG